MTTKARTRVLAILNLTGFILVILMNGLANGLPINGKTTGELSAQYPNLFVPAGFTFSIWGLIYLLLLLFVIRQIRVAYGQPDQENVIQKIGIWFFLSCLANAGWILAWHHELVFLSVLIMIVLFISLLMIYHRLNIGLNSATPGEKLMVHLPFSVYLGWITVALIANTTAWLVNLDWAGASLSEVTWTQIMILVATAITTGILITRKDPFYTLVVLWAFWGIYSRRQADTETADQPVEWTLIIAGTLLILILLIQIFRKKTYMTGPSSDPGKAEAYNEQALPEKG